MGLDRSLIDRVGLLHQLATLREHPKSVPINALACARAPAIHTRRGRCCGQGVFD